MSFIVPAATLRRNSSASQARDASPDADPAL
jgi:hypothetical protein